MTQHEFVAIRRFTAELLSMLEKNGKTSIGRNELREAMTSLLLAWAERELS